MTELQGTRAPWCLKVREIRRSQGRRQRGSNQQNRGRNKRIGYQKPSEERLFLEGELTESNTDKLSIDHQTWQHGSHWSPYAVWEWWDKGPIGLGSRQSGMRKVNTTSIEKHLWTISYVPGAES